VIKKTLRFISYVGVCSVLTHCASQPYKSSNGPCQDTMKKVAAGSDGTCAVALTQVGQPPPCLVGVSAVCPTDYPARVEAPMPPLRYLAWLEGDYQSAYEPHRDVAAEKLHKFGGKVPDVADTEEYLKYLSLLDASGRTTEAGKLLKNYLGKHPNEKRAVFLLGVHYQRAKKKELAHYIFSTLEKDTKFAWRSLVLNNLGMMAFQEKNREKAIDLFEKATKSQPPTAAPHVNLGSLYLQSRSYADAEALFRKALDIDDEFEDAALGLGASLEGQAKFAEAHQVYASFLNDNPDGLSVLYSDAVILGNRLKQRDAAAEMMLRYIQRGGKETAKAHDIIQTWR